MTSPFGGTNKKLELILNTKWDTQDLTFIIQFESGLYRSDGTEDW